MRATVVAVACVAAIPLLSAARPRPHAPALAVAQVTVDARCAGPNTTQVSVQPWNLRVAQGDSVHWVLSANANSDQITITPKRSNAWPFTDGASYVGTKGRPATAGAMRGNARGRYSYNIQLVCQSGNTPPDTILVDPDIFVD